MAHLEVIRPRRDTWWQWAKRSFTLGPFNIKDKELARHFGGRSVAAGVHVDEESSMSFSGVWSAMTGISQDVAKVPLPLYKRVGNGKELYREHRLYELMHDEPNEEMSSFVFRRTMQGHVLVWGNAFAEIERDGAGRPVALWPMMPWAVSPFRDGSRLLYRVAQPSGKDIVFDRKDVLHLSGIGLDGISGYPPIRKAMESIGLGVAAERFGSAFFGNGATFGGIIKYPAGIATTPQTREENRQVIEKRHQGVDRSHRLLTLYEGAEYQQMGIPPEQAQFLETRRFQIEEVARWFNIPVHKLKELQRTSYNSIEHQSIEYATDTLQPWFRMWEGELRLKLIPKLERKQQFFEHITEALTRGDSAAQSELAGKLFSVGAITPNGIAAKFNMNPNPSGDDIYVPSNTMPADLARKYWEAQIKQAEAAAKRAAEPPPAPVVAKSDDEEVKAARARAQAAEDARDLAVENVRRADEARELLAVAKAQNEERHAQEVAQLGEALAEANTSLLAAADRERALAEQVGELENDKVRLRDDIRLIEGQRLAAVTEREAAQAQCAGAERMANEQEQRAIAAEKASDAATAALGEVILERDAAQAKADEQRELAEIAKAGYDQWLKMYDNKELERVAAQTAHDAMAVRAEAFQADLVAARADLATEVDAQKKHKAELEAERDEAKRQAQEAIQQAAIELAGVRVELEHAQRDLGIVKQEAAGAALALETERQRMAAQRATALVSMRALFADATARLIQREIDRARKHQATQEKLRAWVESYYPLHEEVVRSVFLPLVGPWTALAGGDSDDLLRSLVAGHIKESTAAFDLILDSEDDDERSALLERTLRRWESERPERMSNSLITRQIGV